VGVQAEENGDEERLVLEVGCTRTEFLNRISSRMETLAIHWGYGFDSLSWCQTGLSPLTHIQVLIARSISASDFDGNSIIDREGVSKSITIVYAFWI
jgi:hypothetical protein